MTRGRSAGAAGPTCRSYLPWRGSARMRWLLPTGVSASAAGNPH